MHEKFGLRISQLRLAHGMSLSDLSKLVHVSKSVISKYEGGYRLPTLDVLRSLVDALDTSYEYLIDGEECKRIMDVSDLSVLVAMVITAVVFPACTYANSM